MAYQLMMQNVTVNDPFDHYPFAEAMNMSRMHGVPIGIVDMDEGEVVCVVNAQENSRAQGVMC